MIKRFIEREKEGEREREREREREIHITKSNKLFAKTQIKIFIFLCFL